MKKANLRHHRSINKARYHHALIFPESEYDELIDSYYLPDEISLDLRDEYFRAVYATYKANAKDFAQRVRSTFEEFTCDDSRVLNQKYRRFLKSTSSQSLSHESKPDINVLIFNPPSISNEQTTRIHCKEGNIITHQFLNFYDDSLILRISREVMVYLTFLKLVLRRIPTSTHIPSDVRGGDQSNTLPPPSKEEINILLKEISDYSKTTQNQQSLPSQDASSQTSLTSKKNALELYYDLKTCYEKNKHLLDADNLRRSLGELNQVDRLEYAKFLQDLACQRFVEANKTTNADDFKEYAGSKFLGCGIRCSYDQTDPKQVSIERYDYENAVPKTSKTMYLKIKKFDEHGNLKAGRNYRTLRYLKREKVEEKQYCFIKITFDDDGKAEVDSENIYTSNSLNPDQKQPVSLSSLTQEVKNELIQDISQLTLNTKNYYVDRNMGLERKEQEIKLSKFFTEHTEQRDEDRESNYENDGNSDAETIMTDFDNLEQDLKGFDDSNCRPSTSPEVPKGESLLREFKRSRAPSPNDD